MKSSVHLEPGTKINAGDFRNAITDSIFQTMSLQKWIDSEGHTQEFEPVRLDAITTGDLIEFRSALLREGLSVKTARNIEKHYR